MAEHRRRAPPDGRPDRLAEPDAEQDPGEHDEGAERWFDRVQRCLEVRQRQDREGTAADRSDEPGELGQGPGSEAEDRRDRHESDDDDVEEVHPRSMNEADWRARRQLLRPGTRLRRPPVRRVGLLS